MNREAEVDPNEVRMASGPHTPLLYLLLPMMGGFLLGAAFPGRLPLGPALALAGALWGVAALIAFQRRPWRSLRIWGAAFCLSVTVLAWSYYSVRIPPPPDLSRQVSREASLEIKIVREFALSGQGKRIAGLGVILTPPDYRPDFRGQTVYFSCWTTPETAGAARGATIRVRGKLEPTPPAPEGFDAYLRQQGCYLKLSQGGVTALLDNGPGFYRWCETVNRRWREILQTGATAPQTQELADIATAMLLGEKSMLSREAKARFMITGTMHLFAVSGLHVAIVAGLLAALLAWARIPKPARPIAGLALLLIYVQITGAAPSAVRAWWMAFFFWSASGLARKPAPLSALVCSALTVLLINPRELWSAGFQLSYTVVAGLLLYGVPLQDWLRERFEPYRWIPEDSLNLPQRAIRTGLHGFWSLAAISFAASVFSAPLTVGYFGVLAPGSFLLNIPLVTLAPLAMTASLLSVTGGCAGALWISNYCNHASWLFLAGMDGLVRAYAQFPHSSLAVGWRWNGAGFVLAFTMLSAAICLADHRISPKWRFGAPVVILFAGLVIGLEIRQDSSP